MSEFKRYICGSGEGMFETEQGDWVEFSDLEKWQSTAKELAEKLQHLLELHSAEQEALRPPTPMMWYNATLEGSAALEQFKTLTDEPK